MEPNVKSGVAITLAMVCLGLIPLHVRAATAQTRVEIAEAAIECRRADLPGPLTPTDLLASMKATAQGEGTHDDGVPYSRYELSEPVHPYGVKVTHLGVYRDWLVAEIPELARRDLIERLALERAPLDSDEFWFAGADFPERGFVAMFDSGSAIAFGLSASDESLQALVGCNFLSFTRQEFLDDLERQRAILEMFSGFGSGPEVSPPETDSHAAP